MPLKQSPPISPDSPSPSFDGFSRGDEPELAPSPTEAPASEEGEGELQAPPSKGRGKRRKGFKRRATIIRIGDFVTLISEDHYLQAFAPLGMTIQGFRRLLASLRVPTIEIGSTRLVDDLSFQIALRSILRLGQKPFLAPGCTTLAVSASRDHPDYATSLHPERLTQDLSALIAELLLTHGLEAKPSARSAKKAAIQAASRLLSAGLAQMPERLQADVRARSIENLTRVSLEMGINPLSLNFPPSDSP